jgi:hypothetical protein
VRDDFRNGGKLLAYVLETDSATLSHEVSKLLSWLVS